MAVNSTHPDYAKRREDWDLMRDAYAGERAIKDAAEKYLPATAGQKQDGWQPGQPGREAYEAYLKRASFPDIVRAAVEAMIGVMHHKPPVIELPPAMEPLRERATLQGESLEMLLRRINEEQLVSGRLGLLLDVKDGAPVKTLPYVAMYRAESVLNWDDGNREELVLQNLNFVALDESEYERKTSFEWEFKSKYRIAVIGDPDMNEPQGVGTYQVGVFEEASSSFSSGQLITPSIGPRTLNQIPFVFINSKDVVPCPDAPPLLGLARLALTIYRGEADYRQALFMQGQDTLVVIGSSDPEASYRTGANASISLPVGGDAKFIGVGATGLPEMRQALENDKSAAAQKGGQLLDSVSREKESGDALKIRVAARTATLNQIALAGAFGLQTLLRIAAVWIGANPEDVVVTPNLDFADDDLGGEELTKIMTARQLGAPLSLRSIHEMMEEKDMTTRTFEEEMEEISKEADAAAEDGQGGPGAPDDEGAPIEEQPEETE